MDMEKQNNALLVHLLEKVDRVEEHVGAIREDMAEAKADWRYHIKRTDLLEDLVKDLQKGVNILLIPILAARSVLRYLKIIK